LHALFIFSLIFYLSTTLHPLLSFTHISHTHYLDLYHQILNNKLLSISQHSQNLLWLLLHDQDEDNHLAQEETWKHTQSSPHSLFTLYYFYIHNLNFYLSIHLIYPKYVYFLSQLLFVFTLSTHFIITIKSYCNYQL
jgi:hypothetical protein